MSKSPKKSRLSTRPLLGIRFLEAVKWLCPAGSEPRAIVELVLRDLAIDVKDIRRQHSWTFWQFLLCVVPIVWDGAFRIVKAVVPALRWIEKLFPKK